MRFDIEMLELVTICFTYIVGLIIKHKIRRY